MHVFRYGLAIDLEDLTETKSMFYDIYDLKSKKIPSEEEWASRLKEVMSGQDQPLSEVLCMKPSEGESNLHTVQFGMWGRFLTHFPKYISFSSDLEF